jgi:hypothetical protein
LIVFDQIGTQSIHLKIPQKARTNITRIKGHIEVMRTFRIKVDELKTVRFVSVRKQSIERKVEVESVVCFTGLNTSVIS